jgi:glycosyltransferase involved in cell wall biosynthesis
LSHKFYPFIGGIEIISELLAQYFAEAGHEVHLLTWTADRSGKMFPFSVIREPGMQRLFQEHAWADLVFENNPCLRLAWPGIFYGRPSVVALQTWISRVDGSIALKDRFKLHLWLRRASRVIAVSNALRKRCWPEATIIGNPYRAKEFKRLSEIPRSIDFVFLGRLVSDKGVQLAIRAIDKFKKLSTNDQLRPVHSRLTIIGEGPERERLADLVAELKLQDCVDFVGSLRGEALVECLNKHRFLLVPSEWEEPFGVVALEGIACGCVPIASDGGGLPEAIGTAGITFLRGNLDSLVECISKIMNDQAMQDELQKAGINHLKSFDPDFIAGKYLGVIEQFKGSRAS